MAAVGRWLAGAVDAIDPEALSSVILFADSFISAGFVVLVVACIIRVVWGDKVPEMTEADRRLVALMLMVMFLLSAVDRTTNVLVGGVSAHLLTQGEDGSLWGALVILLARFALGMSVWRLVFYVLNSWNPTRVK